MNIVELIKHDVLAWVALFFSALVFAFGWLLWAARGKRDLSLKISGFGLTVDLKSDATDSDPQRGEQKPS